MTRLDEIKARAEAATEGPWSWSGRVAPVLSGYAGTSYRYSKEVIEAEHHGECGCRSDCQLEVTVDPLDAEFIASARSDIPRLVAALEAVLELHKMELDFKGRPFCVECDSNCHSYSGTRCDSPDAPFPCPTVAIVRTALGEGEK